MDTEYIFNLVAEEAENLKSNATAEELERLDFTSFNPDSRTNDVYGQLTGMCHSERAFELIKLCCKHTFTGTLRNPSITTRGHLERKVRDGGFSAPFWSPIEIYTVTAKVSEIKRLFEYLKGKRETLK